MYALVFRHRTPHSRVNEWQKYPFIRREINDPWRSNSDSFILFIIRIKQSNSLHTCSRSIDSVIFELRFSYWCFYLNQPYMLTLWPNSLWRVCFCLSSETITNSCDTMLEDVMDDFHDLDQIKSRFEDWRNQHSESYNEAYIGLCLPKLFTPFVKLGLITWNPLQVRPTIKLDSLWTYLDAVSLSLEGFWKQK